jgi:hypothetical protein
MASSLGKGIPYISSAAGAAVGGYFGGPMGAAVGGRVGSYVGKSINAVTGLGSYKILSNSLMPGAPRVINRNHRGNATIMRHREYVADIVSSSVANTFSVATYPIQPALDNLFLFLSQIACNFEEYSLEGMVVEYKTTSCDALNSVNTALGTVIIATSYNSNLPPFASKGEMESYEFSSACKPSECMLHYIECAPNQSVLTELYCRPGPLGGNQDLRLYDIGNLQVATSGMQGTSVRVGELWISYQIALLKPKLYASLGNFTNAFTGKIGPYVSTAVAPIPSGAYTSTFGNNPLINGIALLTKNTISHFIQSMPIPQNYSLTVYWGGTGVVGAVQPPGATIIGGTFLALNAGPLSSPGGAGCTSNVCQSIIYFNVPANAAIPAHILWDGTGLFPAAPGVYFEILQQIPMFLL